MSDKKNKSQYLRRSNDLQERSCSEVQGSPRRRRLEYNKDTSQPENKRRRISGRDSSPEIFLVSEPQPPTPKKPTPSSSKEPSFSPLGELFFGGEKYLLQDVSPELLDRLLEEPLSSEGNSLDSNSDVEVQEDDSDLEDESVEIPVQQTPERTRPIQMNPPSFVWHPHPVRIPFVPFSSTRTIKILPDGEDPVDYFRLLLTDEIVDDIVSKSNKYAKHVRITKWRPLTRPEFFVFLGLTFHTGTIRMPRLGDYWLNTSFRRGIIPCFHAIMSKERYLAVLQILHFATNPRPTDPTDRLYKIRDLITYFNTRMTEVYSPGHESSPNETLILWRGRQSIPKRGRQYDLKMLMLTEPAGLFIQFLLYGGSAHKKLDSPYHMDGFYNNGPLVTDALQESRIDQLLAYYPSSLKTLNWYKKLAIHLFQILLVNSHVLYDMVSISATTKTFFEFRLDVIESLVFLDYPNRPYLKPVSSLPTSGGHYPSQDDKCTSGPRAGRYPLFMCQLCSKKKTKRRTTYYCKGCTSDVKIGLCPTCFEEWHEESWFN
jgi:hypothetical protein